MTDELKETNLEESNDILNENLESQEVENDKVEEIKEPETLEEVAEPTSDKVEEEPQKNKKSIKDFIKKKADLGPKSFPEHGPIDPNNGKEILLSIRNIDITFGKGDRAVKAVKNASFDIYKGETFSLVGESGSGKTTIGRAVIRVNPLANGEIDYKGVRITGKS